MRAPLYAASLAIALVSTSAYAQDWTVSAGDDAPPAEDDAAPDDAAPTDDRAAGDGAEADGEAGGGEPSAPSDDDDEIELEPEELAELEDTDWDVSAFGNAREIKRVAGSAYRVDEKELERFEDDNIHNVMRRIPGVYVRGEDGYGLRPNIGMRGATARRSAKIALEEDGVLFGPAPYSAPAAYYFPLTTRMSAIEVFKGPSALRHGPNTIGGAINLVTRPIPWGHEFGSDLALGNNAYGKGHAYYGYGEDHWGVLIEGVRLRSDGFKRLDNNVTGRNTGFDKIETMLKARVNTDPAGDVYNEAMIKLGYSHERSNETYLGITDADFRDDAVRRYPASALDNMRWNRFQVELSHGLAVGDWLRMRTTAYRHDFDRTWLRFDGYDNQPVATNDILNYPDAFPDLYRGLTGEQDSDDIIVVDNHRVFVSQGIQTSASIKLPRLWRIDQRVKVGGRLHYDSVDRVHTDHFYAMRGGNLRPRDRPFLIANDNDAHSIALASYVVDEIAIWRFLLTPGVRTEYIINSLEERQTGDRIENTQGVVLPGLGVLFEATQNISLLASVHEGFSPQPPGQAAGSKPEKAVNYEFGGRMTTDVVEGEAIGFVSDYSNLTGICIDAAGCDPGDLDQGFNAGKVLVYGVEIGSKAEIPTPIDLTIPITASYTFTRGTFGETFTSGFWGDVQKGDTYPFIPPHQFAATGGIASKRWGSFVLGATYVDAIREVAGRGEPGPGEATDPYVIFDAAATVQITEQIAVYAKAGNLLDNRFIISHRPFGARPGRPRYGFAGVKVHLD